MAVIKGKPLVAIGAIDALCDAGLGKVPDVCKICRQVERWMPRTVAWATNTNSRFKAILQTVLRGHDEILSSLCGTCANNSKAATDCNCQIQTYLGLGLSLAVKTHVQGNCSTVIKSQIKLNTTCRVVCNPCPGNDCFKFTAEAANAETCWLEDCADLCGTCKIINLDPCNVPDHLDIILRIIPVATSNYSRRATGANIIAALNLLFPGSNSAIVNVNAGTIYATVGRNLTPLEQTFLPYLISFVPLGFRVNLKLVTPCI